MKPTEETTDPHFGACPICHCNDGYLNLAADEQCFVCAEHKKYWYFDSYLFSDCPDGNAEEDWRRNVELIREYTPATPWYLPSATAAREMLAKPGWRPA